MRSSTAIVIGGGVVGLSTAYHLARKKFGRIILIEKGTVGDGSSSRAAGIITGLLWGETGVLTRKKSLALYRELSHELEGYQFQDVGCLNIFDLDSWREREKLLPLYDRLDTPFEIMDAAEMRRRWPALNPSEEWMGLFDPLGGYSEPDEYIPALTQKIKSLGVEVRESQTVTGFLMQNGRVAGVKTASGEIDGDAVVSTVHVWTPTVTEQLGLQFPVKPFVHQRYVTKPLPGPVHIPAINANPLGGYIRPAAGHRLLAGAETERREEYRVTSTDFHMSALSAPSELKHEITTNFVPFVPVLGNTSWETEKIGLIAFAMDGEPILGPVAELPGFYIGIAFHSGGFAYNPVAGFLLAEFVADGQTSIDVSEFSPDRFDPREVEAHLRKTVPQADAIQRRH
jgi:glycine/D-amino acid oxidase-like deaminating enzyme